MPATLPRPGLPGLRWRLPAFALIAAAVLAHARGDAAEVAPPGGAVSATPPAAPPDPALVEQGRRIYMDGLLPSGAPLRAARLGAAPLEGTAAACVACHRRSGMGSVEGNTIVPPITGLALHPGAQLRNRVVASMDPRRGRFWNPAHAPYDDASLLAAVRDGMHVSGRPMDALMPRYAVGEPEMRALGAYLDALSTSWSPGVSADAVRLATVITPDVDPQRRAAFLQTLRAVVEQKNSNTMPGHRHMINAAEMVMRIERRWDLDVWELEGDPQTWAAQLQARYDQAPVFALVSGLGEGRWDPVQDFCEREHVPCWFPSVPLPPAQAGEQFYGLYFSQGVRLEAQVLARQLRVDGAAVPGRVVQLMRDGDAARGAALALDEALGRTTEHWPLDGQPTAALRARLAGLRSGDVLVVWSGPAGLVALQELPPPAARTYFSGELGADALAQLPAAWRNAARVVYPYELPGARVTNMATFRSWVALRGLPLVDEAMQSEVFFAVNYLQYTLSEMLDNPYRDYLVERGESMLQRHELQRAEEETITRQQGHPPAKRIAARATLAPGAIYGTDPAGPLAQGNTQAIGVRQGTTIYPRLSLAPGQRFASKGAYVARFAGADHAQLQVDSDWTIP
jgi:hypothetical protein